MSPESLPNGNKEPPTYLQRTPADYIEMLDAEVRSGFTQSQLAAVQQLLAEAIPRPAPKLIDLRFSIDLLAYRYYVVLYVGKDQRRQDRPELVEPTARKGNAIIALALIFGLNLLIGLVILLIAYAIKSAIGYSLLPHSKVAG